MKISITEFNKFNNIIMQMNDQAERHVFQKEMLYAIGDLIPYDNATFYDSSLNVLGDKLSLDSLVGINIDDEMINTYNSHFYKADPTLTFISNPSYFSYRTSDFNKVSSLLDSDYYNGFLKTHNIFFEMGINIAFNQNYLGAVTLFRSENSSEFSEKECYFFQMLQPHISKHMGRMNCFSGGESFAKISFDHSVLNTMKIYKLSPRETEILKLVLQGYNNNEICEILFIELNTVKTHIKHIFNKMSICSRIQAIKIVLSLS